MSNLRLSANANLQNDKYQYLKYKTIEAAKKNSRFSHPKIVRVVDIFETNNTAFLMMDFITGSSLKTLVHYPKKSQLI